MPYDERERRYKLVYLSPRFVRDLLNVLSADFQHFHVPHFPGLPAGYEVIAVHYESTHHAFAALVYHESWPVIPLGDMPPAIAADVVTLEIPAEETGEEGRRRLDFARAAVKRSREEPVWGVSPVRAAFATISALGGLPSSCGQTAGGVALPTDCAPPVARYVTGENLRELIAQRQESIRQAAAAKRAAPAPAPTASPFDRDWSEAPAPQVDAAAAEPDHTALAHWQHITIYNGHGAEPASVRETLPAFGKRRFVMRPPASLLGYMAGDCIEVCGCSGAFHPGTYRIADRTGPAGQPEYILELIEGFPGAFPDTAPADTPAPAAPPADSAPIRFREFL